MHYSYHNTSCSQKRLICGKWFLSRLDYSVKWTKTGPVNWWVKLLFFKSIALLLYCNMAIHRSYNPTTRCFPANILKGVLLILQRLHDIKADDRHDDKQEYLKIVSGIPSSMKLSIGKIEFIVHHLGLQYSKVNFLNFHKSQSQVKLFHSRLK